MKQKSLILLIAGIFFTAISMQTMAQNWNLNGNKEDANSNSKLGTIDNVPLKFYTKNAQRMVIDSLGNVGINTLKPVNLLTVQLPGGSDPTPLWAGGGTLPVFMGFGEEKSTGFNLATAGSFPNLRPVLNTKRSRGTLGSPAIVSNNDYLASIVSAGYDGVSFQNPAAIDFYVDGIPAPGIVPARISFVTGSNTANRLERLKIGSNGDVSVVTGNLIMSSPLSGIQFSESATTSAPMITMFASVPFNYDRMVISHSLALPKDGLQYQDEKLNFVSGGIPILTADLGAKAVGIGTSLPRLAKLVVEGVKGNTVALFRGSPTGKGISLVTDNPGIYFNSYWDTHQKAMAPGYAGILNFDPVAGNISLGTSPASATKAGDPISSPPALLINKNKDVSIQSGDLVIGSSAKTIQFATPTGNSVPMMTMFPSGFNNPDRMVISTSPASANWGIQYQDAPDKFNFLANGNPVLTADLQLQRVGIGTSDIKRAKFAVQGVVDHTVALFSGSAGSRGISLVADYPGVYFNSYFNGQQKAMAAGYAGILNFDYLSGNLYMGCSSLPAANADDNISTPPALLITKTGNVGIGTSSPGYKLSVKGTIQANEVRVETGWADYVFDKNYKLRPLNEVAQYISDHKHLPDVPTASYVQQNGLAVGQMQTKMMQKIEELTLYVIDLQKEILELKSNQK